LSAAIVGSGLALSIMREQLVASLLASISWRDTHVFRKDSAMTVEEEINELIAPNIRKRLLLPYVPEHLQYMEANEDKIFLSGPFINEGQLVGEGLTVLRVDSEQDAHALMQAEPLIKHGVRRYELKVWEVREGSLSFETKLSRSKLFLS
jgi:uncharacterized protein YciI